MLTAIVLTLTSPTPANLPAHLGRANFAETLANLARVTPGLDDTIHALPGLKPLTCSGLEGGYARKQGRAFLRAHEEYWVRVTGLTEEVSLALQEAILVAPPPIWTLQGHAFTVTGATCEGRHHPWAGASTYEMLAVEHMLTEAGDRALPKVTLHFASPTAFKQHEMNMPLPLPNLVFGNLVDRWNAFSPVTLNPEMRDFGELAIEVSRFAIESVLLEQKGKGWRVGAMGEVTYTALNRDRYWLRMMQLLAAFAFYSGVGAQTTAGMGQVRVCR